MPFPPATKDVDFDYEAALGENVSHEDTFFLSSLIYKLRQRYTARLGGSIFKRISLCRPFAGGNKA